MSALGQNQPFCPRQSNVRFTPESGQSSSKRNLRFGITSGPKDFLISVIAKQMPLLSGTSARNPYIPRSDPGDTAIGKTSHTLGTGRSSDRRFPKLAALEIEYFTLNQQRRNAGQPDEPHLYNQ
jgi:hypothetical protein